MSDTTGDHPGVLIFPPLLFLICVAVGLIAHFVCPYRFGFGWWLRGSGIALVAAAIAFASWGRRTMQSAGTNINPGMPALAVVSSGPFAFTRNPLYLSLLVMFSGIGFAAASPAFLVLVVPFFLVLHFGVVVREERYMDAKFGDDYRGYKGRVRRWI